MNGIVLADWLQSIAPLIVVFFWVLRAVLSGKQEEGPVAPGRRPKERTLEEALREAMGEEEEEDQPKAQQARAAGGPEAQQQRAEVEEFLERIGKSPRDAPAEEPTAEPEPPRRRPQDPFEEPRRRAPAPVAARGTNEIELLIDDQAEAAAEAGRAPEPVGGLSQQHLPESQLAEQAAHLGERIAAADERFESRLHDKFEHRLGRLEERGRLVDSPTDNDQQPATTSQQTIRKEGTPAAKRVAEMLARPGGFRDAVVLSEILNRPSDPFAPSRRND